MGARLPVTATDAERAPRAADLTRRQRRRRAPQAFGTALLDLLLMRDREDITATDVITASGFSRGSFYHYFHDLDDLLERLVCEEVDGYVELVARAVSVGIGASEFDRVYRVARELIDHVDGRRPFFRALFSREVTCIDFDAFCERAIAQFRRVARVELVDGGAVDEDFYYACTTRSFLVYLGYWVQTDFSVPPDRIAWQIAVMNAGDAAGLRPRFVIRDEQRQP